MNAFISNLIRKLSSRKLWMAVAVVGTGISVALGVDATEIQTIAGSLTALLGAVAYIVTEGKIDAANIGTIVQGAEDIKTSFDSMED